MIKYLLLTFLFMFLTTVFSIGQDKDYAQEVINKLSSKEFGGRGYVKDGEKKAARYIRKQFKKNNALAFNNDYFQTFTLGVNTFPSKLKVEIDGHALEPARDFIIHPYSSAASGTYELAWIEKDTLDAAYLSEYYKNNDLSNKVIVVNKVSDDTIMKYKPPGAAGSIFRVNHKIWWYLSRSGFVNEKFCLDITEGALPKGTKKITIEFHHEFIDHYSTQNVIAYVKGKSQPDSFIVFTAHYDHLGYMGKKVYFPGANDNASGTAMIVDLARHFGKKENQPDCSIAFIAMAAEETGLQGAKYYVHHPLFPLKNIKFLVNLDMVGTGSAGITVVNGGVLPDAFSKLEKINKENNYLKEVKSRGESCNSDHCPFYMQGVPSVFIYTRGSEFSEYHNPDDVAEKLPLTEYEDLFSLLVDFVLSF